MKTASELNSSQRAQPDTNNKAVLATDALRQYIQTWSKHDPSLKIKSDTVSNDEVKEP